MSHDYSLLHGRCVINHDSFQKLIVLVLYKNDIKGSNLARKELHWCLYISPHGVITDPCSSDTKV